MEENSAHSRSPLKVTVHFAHTTAQDAEHRRTGSDSVSCFCRRLRTHVPRNERRRLRFYRPQSYIAMLRGWRGIRNVRVEVNGVVPPRSSESSATEPLKTRVAKKPALPKQDSHEYGNKAAKSDCGGNAGCGRDVVDYWVDRTPPASGRHTRVRRSASSALRNPHRKFGSPLGSLRLLQEHWLSLSVVPSLRLSLSIVRSITVGFLGLIKCSGIRQNSLCKGNSGEFHYRQVGHLFLERC